MKYFFAIKGHCLIILIVSDNYENVSNFFSKIFSELFRKTIRKVIHIFVKTLKKKTNVSIVVMYQSKFD